MIANKKNIQILLESVVRCGGSCSGCALSSSERMTKIDFNFYNFEKQLKLVYHYIKKEKLEDIESISLFLGQGDHFLLDTNDIHKFTNLINNYIPTEYKYKMNVFISASAIGNISNITEKMELFYEKFLEYKIPFFIQTVFDPKKVVLNKNQKFKPIYMQNINYFKNKCGMTELTINLGDDFLNYLKPIEFHNWLIDNGITHVELNWVLNDNTKKMFFNNYQQMYQWLKNFVIIYENDSNKYEINFLPFLQRHFKFLDFDYLKMNENILDSLENNLYIDFYGNVSSGQMGMINNFTPLEQRSNQIQKINIFQKLNKLTPYDEQIEILNFIENIKLNNLNLSKKIHKSYLLDSSCIECDLKSTCSISGTYPLKNEFKNSSLFNKTECPFNIKDFLIFMNNKINSIYKNKKENTIYNLNPIQNVLLKNKDNSTFDFFIEKFK